MNKKIDFELKELLTSLSGTCFWYWNSFYSFLDSCGVSKNLQKKFPKESYNKYQTMRNVLDYLEETNDIDTINNIISNFFKLRGAVDRDALDDKKAKQLLSEFRTLVGNDPIEIEIKRRKREEVREKGSWTGRKAAGQLPPLAAEKEQRNEFDELPAGKVLPCCS